ncbi:hypothetical protein MTR67_051544, partial [Solanum verrucosum]
INIKGSSYWNIASVGQLIWQIIENKELLWVQWVHGIYIKVDASIWTHKAPLDCRWYWKRINAIKVQMQGWYTQDIYKLTQSNIYYITKSYLAIIGRKPQIRNVGLIWTSLALPNHRFMVSLVVQGRLLTQERKLKLIIQVDNTDCCLCDEKAIETNVHLFDKCKWTSII